MIASPSIEGMPILPGQCIDLSMRCREPGGSIVAAIVAARAPRR
jgi:hypothetical protein